MGKKCFVPNCNSGYRTCAERVPLFKAPSEHARLETWRRTIPRSDRALQSSDHVCAKHFPDEMVCAKYYVESNGRVLLDAPKRPTLSVNGVLCIFPGCPKYLTREQKSRKSPQKRQPTTSDRPVAGKVVLPAKTACAETDEQAADARPLKKLRVDSYDSAPCQAHSSGENAPLAEKCRGIGMHSPDLEILGAAFSGLTSGKKNCKLAQSRKTCSLQKSTAEGLRVTLASTRDLCHVMLTVYNFRYVLTSKFTQDPIKRFFLGGGRYG
ncbi:hypothetical protein HPB48_009081 [Haemaphysalis longicornis]|uniref:THAP-type domain-containing protein n=1 Tax=Haemaphysalis longicornis TaxID=44386 RepID=A0A9J6FXJ4_HAELO|nr:hypothetical protein HPB48_009081 [Haemaphysalis longicornis]